jgi:GNAT superfamily N-acetyltransferase
MNGIAFALHRDRPITPALVRALYDHAGWWPERTLAAIGQVLDSAPAVGAWNGERLVGFARAVTDGNFRAYIEDVVVHEAWRRQGVATLMMACLLDELKGIPVVSLFCKAGLVPVYQGQGFQETRQVVMHKVRS